MDCVTQRLYNPNKVVRKNYGAKCLIAASQVSVFLEGFLSNISSTFSTEGEGEKNLVKNVSK